MNLISLISILDSSILVREVISFKSMAEMGTSYHNVGREDITVSINEDDYTNVIRICLVPKGESVIVYLSNYTNTNLHKIDLEDVSSFSIS